MMSGDVCTPGQSRASLPNRMEKFSNRIYIRALDQYEKIMDNKRNKSGKKVSNGESVKEADKRRARPSELLRFLAANALELAAPAMAAPLKTRDTNVWFQLAGHPGSLAPAAAGTVWKRGGPAGGTHPERDAYHALAACPHMRTAVPRYYRELERAGERYVELQDLLHGFQDPHVVDVKMGTRTFLESEVTVTAARQDLYEKMVRVDPNAPTEEEHAARAVTKLRYMQFRERQSSTGSEGFRVEALKLPGSPPMTELQTVRERSRLLATLARFLDGREDVRRRLVARLEDIRERFERSEFFKHHELVGSSIFMIFDEHKVGAWLIDFAKTRRLPEGVTVTHRAPWLQGNHEEGFLFGLDNLIQAMKSVDLNDSYLDEDPEVTNDVSEVGR